MTGLERGPGRQWFKTEQSRFYLFGGEREVRTREQVATLPVSAALYSDCLGERVFSRTQFPYDVLALAFAASASD
jgi:hypothetical protein